MGKGSRQIPSLMALIPASSPPSPPSLSPPAADRRSPSSFPIFPRGPKSVLLFKERPCPPPDLSLCHSGRTPIPVKACSPGSLQRSQEPQKHACPEELSGVPPPMSPPEREAGGCASGGSCLGSGSPAGGKGSECVSQRERKKILPGSHQQALPAGSLKETRSQEKQEAQDSRPERSSGAATIQGWLFPL